MDAFQITNALSAAFFGLLGIWAAVAQRHWFLRLVVVAVFLLSALLIPAYEVVIEFGIQIAIIALVVQYYRHGLRLPRTFSMETALLGMTVLAVAAAVAAQMPDLGWQRWLKVVGVGVMTALAALLSLWLVCGRKRLSIRIVLSLIGVAGLAILFFIGGSLEYVEYVPFSIARWSRALQPYFTITYFIHWIGWGLPSILLGLFVTTLMLILARASGWFTLPREPQTQGTRRALAARLALGALTVAVATPLVFVLLALLFPPPLPAITLPAPNGYDDFVAAGKLAPEDVFPRMRRWDSMSWTERRESYELVQPTVARIASGVAKECVRDPFADRASAGYESEMSALLDASAAMILHLLHLEHFGTTNEYAAACLLDLEFGEKSIRGSGTYEADGMALSSNAHRLSKLLGDLNADQCRDLSLALSHFEQSRESYELKSGVQAHIDQHSDWETRLNYLLTEWSGFEHYPQDYWGRRHIAEFRLLILNAALQTYFLEKGRPPETLDELMPDYLAQIPDDPLGEGQLKYRRNGDAFVIYSCGFDEDDDDGSVEEDLTSTAGGDMIVRGPAAPSARKQLLDFGRDVYQQYLEPLAPKGDR